MISAIAFVGSALVLSLLRRKRIERVLAPVFCAWMVLLTALAALNRLQWTDMVCWALVVAEAAGLAFLLFNRSRRKEGPLGRDLLRYVLTPGLLIFGLLTAFFFVVCKPLVVWWGDDLLYWALQPKALWFQNGLTDSLGSLAPDFGTYTPGMPVMQWFMCHIFGDFSENLLYFTLFLSYVIFLLPLCEGVTWKRWWFIPLALGGLVALPALCGALSYTFLSVDTALAACFAFVLLALLMEPSDPFAVLCGLCGLVLLKQSGLLLCLMALCFALFIPRALRGKGESRDLQNKNFLKARRFQWLVWLAPLFLWGLWMLYCRLAGLSGVHTQRTFGNLSSLLSGSFGGPSGWSEMPAALWYALTHLPATGKLLTALPVLALPKLWWLLLLIAFPLLMARAYGLKPMLRLSALTAVSSAVYVALVLGSFFTTFGTEISAYSGEKINNLCLLLERYLAPLLMGFGAVELFLALGLLLEKEFRLAQKLCTTAVLLVVFLLCANWPIIGDTLFGMNQEEANARICVADATEETNFWADSLEERSGAVVLVGFSDYAEYIENLCYTFAPARILLPAGDSDDPQALQEDIIARHITHVVCLDDATPLYAAAAELTEDQWLETYALYAVEEGADGPGLTSVE